MQAIRDSSLQTAPVRPVFQASDDGRSTRATVLLGLVVTALTLFIELQLIRTVGWEPASHRHLAEVARSADPASDASRLEVEARPVDPRFRVNWAADH